MGKLLLIAASLLPIWKDPSWEGGVNAWQAIYNLATKPQKEHIPTEQAIEECCNAYQSKGW